MFEDSTSWVFLSPLYRDSPVMSSSLATSVCAAFPCPHPGFMKVAIASQKRQNHWSLKLLLEATACLVVLWKLIQWKLALCQASPCNAVHKQIFVRLEGSSPDEACGCACAVGCNGQLAAGRSGWARACAHLCVCVPGGVCGAASPRRPPTPASPRFSACLRIVWLRLPFPITDALLFCIHWDLNLWTFPLPAILSTLCFRLASLPAQCWI